MKFTQKTVASFKLCLTENESEHANAVAAAAGIDVMELLVALLDSSLNESYEGLMHMHDHDHRVEMDADGFGIPTIDDVSME